MSEFDPDRGLAAAPAGTTCAGPTPTGRRRAATVPLGRRRFLRAAAGLAGIFVAAPRGFAFGEDALFDMPLVEYDAPSWNPRPSAIRRALLEIEMTTSIRIVAEPGTVALELEQLVETPLAVWCGDRAFDPLSDAQRDALRTWLSAGGMLFIDGSEGREDGGFDASVRRELEYVLPDTPLEPIGDDHVLWRTFYIVDRTPGRVAAAEHFYGATRDDRLAVIYSPNDVLGAWARDNYGNWEYEVHPGGAQQREMTVRFGVNLAMYALCLDYKEDQVHVDYLLRRRRWNVD